MAGELSMTIQFLLFLLAFLLILNYPAVLNGIQSFLNYLYPRDRTAIGPSPAVPLNEMEFLVLQRLARLPTSKLSVKQLSAELHLSRSSVELSLSSLYRQGMVRFSRPFLVGKHFALSRKGVDYAIAQGFIPSLPRRGKKAWL